MLILVPKLKKMQRQKIFRRIIIPALISIIFWVLAMLMSSMSSRVPDYSELAETISEKVGHKEELLKTEVERISGIVSEQADLSKGLQFIGTRNSDFPDFAFYVYRNDQLLYWSSNTIPVNGHEKAIIAANHSLIRLSNGFYLCVAETNGEYTTAGLMPVYYEYPYENRFLSNGFAAHLNIKTNALLSTDNIPEYTITSGEGGFLFSILPPSGESDPLIASGLIFMVFLISLSAFFFLIAGLLFRENSSAWIVIPVMLILAVAVRFFQIRFLFPEFLYTSELFSPVHYAWNTWFASLGDLLTHIYLFLLLSILFWRRYHTSVRYFRNRYKRIVFVLFLAMTLMLMFVVLNVLLETLIINSTLLLSFDDILKLKSIDVAGFLAIIMMVLAFVWASYIFLYLLRKNLRFRNEIAIFFVFLSAVSSIFILRNPEFLIPVMAYIAFVCISLLLSRKLFSIAGAWGIICMFLFTVSFGTVINKQNIEKEKSYRNIYALQLSNEQDPVGEYLFEEISNSILSDSLFFSQLSISEDPHAFAEEYLRRNYLNGYFSKYHIQITICKPDEILLIVPSNVEVPCNEFFTSLKMQFGTPTMVPDYWLIDDETGRPNYLFEFEFLQNSKNGIDTALLFLEMITIPKITGMGYPELLVEEKVIRKSGRYDYVYAKYFNDELILQYGEYYYPLLLDKALKKDEPFLYSQDGYSHLLYPVNEKTSVIVSLLEKKPFEKAATFSYLLLLMTVFHYLFYFAMALTGKQNLSVSFAFRTRLQTASIFLVILSFIVAGIITVNFFIRYHNNKNKEIIREKSFSLLVELEHKLRNYETLIPEDGDYLSELMTKFSNVFFTDINLFSTSGQLIATSRPQIYQQGLTSELMNPYALYQLRKTSIPYLLENEFIGKLNYTSSWLPFKNYKNEVIAYLNLPYFARENELKKEISSFLITFINFYVVLIALAIIIALVIANYMTMPLRIIGEKLRALKPGQPNEKIQWKKQDDIGILVSQYNRMVDELAASMRQLMQSERESAWHEMAKQIAHEIKNPLTPMKLSLQSLQRAWNDKAPDYEERMKKTSQTLIEQIDALSQIATEFANFAKLQEKGLYPLNIIPVIHDVIHLYESEQTSIEFIYNDAQSYFILGDDTQLIQILNNILKNAVQAIPAKEPGEIVIKTEKSGDRIIISIHDNGSGIPEEIRNKIFSPNFTSKSGGTGLGLAITRKITDHLGGAISFESEINKGSVFYLSFPEYRSEETS
jgi:two-component system, NtrC family, nitrogen regulation sensor histidine kinase NtrY